MSDYPDAVVREIDGQWVLDDPTALGVIAAVESHNYGVNKSNCQATLAANGERVAHFKKRVEERGDSPSEIVIVLINADDKHGGPLANVLMPGNDWQVYRDKGEIPFARGLAMLDGVCECIALFDPQAARRLKDEKEMGFLAVVVIDHGVACTYRVEDFLMSWDGP